MIVTLMPLFASKSAASLLMVVSIGFGESRVIWVCARAPGAAPRIRPRIASSKAGYFMAATIPPSVSIVNDGVSSRYYNMERPTSALQDAALMLLAQRNRFDADRAERREWIPLGHYSL